MVNEDSAEAMVALHTHSHAQCAHSMAADAVNACNVAAGAGAGTTHFKEQGRVAALAAASANGDANAEANAADAEAEVNAAVEANVADEAEAKAADDAEAESNDANAYADAYVPEDAVADAVNGEGGAALICGRGAKSAMLKSV